MLWLSVFEEDHSAENLTASPRGAEFLRQPCELGRRPGSGREGSQWPPSSCPKLQGLRETHGQEG